MTAYQNFTKEISKLRAFYNSAIYAYDQTDYFLALKRKRKAELENLEIVIDLQPNFYISKKADKENPNHKHLREIVFVRIISALEVYMKDSILDVFKKTKTPFKIKEKKLSFNHDELLSMNSTADIFSKLIQDQLRNLKNGGLEELVLYYKDVFKIDIDKSTEIYQRLIKYHKQRHLLIHQLGKVDDDYRKKYLYEVSHINIDEMTLLECFKDFSEFVNSIEATLKEKIKIDFNKKKSITKIEKQYRIKVEILKGNPEILKDEFQFSVDAKFFTLSKILRDRDFIDAKNVILNIAGNTIEVEQYKTLLEKEASRNKINIEYLIKKKKQQIPLSKEILKKIREVIPPTPWKVGIHVELAEKLELPTRDVVRGLIYYNRTEFERIRNEDSIKQPES